MTAGRMAGTRVWIRWRPWQRRSRIDVGAWHWWCPCCMGGSWEITQPAALDEALLHVRRQHR